MNRRLFSRFLVVLGIGLLIAVTVAVAAEWPARDIVLTGLLAAGGALIAGVLGAAVIRRFRGRSSEVQTLVVAFTSIAVLVTGIVVAARAMFISSHDLAALFVVVAISAAIAVGAAMQLGHDIGTGARHIEVLALELGDEPTGDDRLPVLDRWSS